jgi:hypothetical protein
VLLNVSVMLKTNEEICVPNDCVQAIVAFVHIMRHVCIMLCDRMNAQNHK